MPPNESPAALSTWKAPECPFVIAYSPRALDDIRLAVTDAFFSLPRGGVEIGGILLGNWDGKRLAITEHVALDCEHAFGPSFTLSPKDEARLAALLVAPAAKGLRPAGWYHSHTRSEIGLSDADQKIHRRFFPEKWQVALVLKPHTFHPTKAGFFFRGADGNIRETSYNEFVVDPLAARPATGAPASTEPESAPSALAGRNPSEPPPVAAGSPQPIEAPSMFSSFDSTQPRSRKWWWVTAALIAGFALGAALYLTRDSWWPPLQAITRPHSSVPVLPALGLNTVDNEGQLQIRWNRDSAAVQHAAGGVLSIASGGNVPQEIQLDKAHLRSGVVTVTRQTERVDASLSLTQGNGSVTREVTTFMGKLPDRKAAQDQLSSLAKQVARMQNDLNSELQRSTNLEKAVDDLAKQVRDQQKSRGNSVPDKN